jgi:uncharacterized membrane protein
VPTASEPPVARRGRPGNGEQTGSGPRAGLLPEGRRAYLAAASGSVLGVALRLTTGSSSEAAYLGLADDVLVIMAGYQLTYVVLTLAVFAGTTADDADRAAAVMPPGTWVRRWIAATEPGAGAALTVGLLAMAAAVVVLPQASTLDSRFSPGALALLCVALIATAWATMVVTYSVDYLRRDRQEGGLDFPGPDRTTFADYLYFSLAVGTTFGTTDVTVTSTAVRRTVTGQALVAFVFNTVIISLSVGSIAALAAR